MHARRVDGEWSGGGKRGQRGKGRRSTERRNGGEWSGGGREGEEGRGEGTRDARTERGRQ